MKKKKWGTEAGVQGTLGLQAQRKGSLGSVSVRSWERQYRKGVGAEGLRVEANFSNEGFPDKGDQGSLKHRGGQSH